MARVLHVSPAGSDSAEGGESAPFRTIGRAALLARPGDTVLVHEGEYREWVRPARGGLSDARRITYAAADGERVVVKGSERVTGWRREEGAVWTVDVPNALFGDHNPFALEIAGDWVVYPGPDAPRAHLGDVYLDGRSFYEATSREQLQAPERRTEVLDPWTGLTVPVRDPEQTRYLWFAEVGEDVTTIWATFPDADPNDSLVEINVRRSVFAPVEHHIDWITVRGFELAQAATPWAPPTADQPGLIGPNWAKGWIIEDNDIHDSKCVGVSLGKEASTGQNWASERRDKPGYQYQLESVFSAAAIGWDREHIGSHIVRRNRIHDCGQAGIVGHLGCVFSTIEDNHIHDIAVKREFYGYELGGIKLHAPIDVDIRRNRIHDCSLGIWLDWQTQGTRVRQNVMYANERDLLIEVSHGPYVVDHNVFASPVSLEICSQGGAYLNNLVCGTVRLEQVPDRATPYHVPHSTAISGVAIVAGGDDRYIGNVFLGGDRARAYAEGTAHHETAAHGLAAYAEHPADYEEYLSRVYSQWLGDHERFNGKHQPLYARRNVYAAGGEPFRAEEPVVLDGPAAVRVVEEGDEVYLVSELPEAFSGLRAPVVTAADLPPARFAGADFEERDGSPLRVDEDLVGDIKDRGQEHPPGPLAGWTRARTRLRIW